MLTLKNVSKTVGDLTILDQVYLDLPKGKISVILGPSGGGKTTLIRQIAGLDQPDDGSEIVMDKDPLFKKSKPTHRIGMVFQGFNLFPHLNVLDNLILACECHDKSQKEQYRVRAENLLKQFDLLDKANHYPHQLSGGQKQRIAIARTLMMDPEIILFDEPTSALDPEKVYEVSKIIQKLKDKNRIILIISHELRFAHYVADDVIFMDKGKILDHIDAKTFLDPHQSDKLSERAQTYLRNMM